MRGNHRAEINTDRVSHRANSNQRIVKDRTVKHRRKLIREGQLTTEECNHIRDLTTGQLTTEES